jgi:hypothetical protein
MNKFDKFPTFTRLAFHIQKQTVRSKLMNNKLSTVNKCYRKVVK